MIKSYGFGVNADDATNGSTATIQSRADLKLLLHNQQSILECAEYFFSVPATARCSWPYVEGDGPLPVGYLLLGWLAEIFQERCTECGGNVYLVQVSGSPLSGCGSWYGICPSCDLLQTGKEFEQKKMFERVLYVNKLRRMLSNLVEEIIEYDGDIFDWGIGLKRTRKRELQRKQLVEPVLFEVLLRELAGGKLRPPNQPNVAMFESGLPLKLC